MPFDPTTAKPLTAAAPAFDPASAKPASSFNPATARPAKASEISQPVKSDVPGAPGLLTKVGQIAASVPKAAGAGLKDLGQEVMKEGTQNAYDIKGDVTAPVQSHDKQGKPGKPGVMDYAARAGKTAMDVINRPFVPIEAAATSVLGRPLEQHTGIKKEVVGDVAGMVVPFAGDIRAALKSPQIIDGAKAFERIMSPTTVSKEAGGAEKIIRKAGGVHSLQAEKTAANLVEGNKVVANLPQQDQIKLIDYIENRSKTPGVKLGNPALQATADKIAKAYGDYKAQVQKIIPATASQKFIDDYYVHMWKDKPTIVRDKMGAFARQGSGRNLKLRTIPTISDGIKAGLTPITTNPIEATTMYAQNMSKFLATHDMQNEMKLQGYAKWFSPGSKNIPKGWVPLKGILTEKTAPMTKGGAVTGGRQIKLFAPPDVARVFNNYISKGLESGDAGPIFSGARHLANGLTMLKLGLSPFHLDTMANESITSGLARGYKAASQGRLGTAAKAFGTAVARPVIDYRRGMKMQRELLDKAMPDATSKAVNEAFVRSGGRLKMDPFYRTRASGSFFNALEKGTFKSEVKAAAERIYKGTPWEKTKGVADLVGNVIQTTAAPIFEKYIPAVKRGAFASAMEDWLKANPGATQEAVDKAAIKLSDSIDNRFGELVQDNLFWHRQMKQIAQIALLSPTWDLGTIREIGGGLKDIPSSVRDVAKGKGISDRTAYVAALATEVALKNAVYQYIKTGSAPQSPKDLMAGRTGGTDIASGKPERVITPGYEKDVYAFGYDFPHNVLQESANKLNPALQAAYGLVANKDYRGLPIYGMEGAPVPEGQPGLSDYLLEQMLPITFGKSTKGVKKGSNIGTAERMLMADRPAPAYIQDPDRVQRLTAKANRNLMHRRVKADARAKAQQQ